MPAEEHLPLAEGAAYTVADWEAAAAAVLRKAGRMSEEDADDVVWARLTRRTLDDVAVPPLGTPSEPATVGRPTRAGDWDVRAHLPAGSPNAEVLAELEGGATSLWLTVAPDTDLTALLDGVLLDVAGVVLEDADPEQWRALVDLGAGGGSSLGVDARDDRVVEATRLAVGTGLRGVVVDGTTAHDRGASDAQELGYALAVGAAYLRRVEAAGLDLDAALGAMEFRYAATDEQLPTIAKLRAARRLWTRVVQLCGGGVIDQRVHAVTSRAMLSAYDPWVNLVRATIAAFSAGVGGADAVTVLPFDEPLGRPDAFGRRLARNTSLLLQAESHVSAVADPAGGAYAVERLTDDLAHAAWEVFGAIESHGWEAFEARVAETVTRRDEQVATRRRPITGLSEFPALGETRPEREPDPHAPVVRRWGAAFEALRDEPAAGRVFLATMGPVAAHTVRATWARNLFAAGGVETVEAGACDDVPAVLAAYHAEGSPTAACLAGPDAAYAEWGRDLVDALKEAGAQRVVVAGKAGDLGVDDAVATGDDVIAFLTRTREAL